MSLTYNILSPLWGKIAWSWTPPFQITSEKFLKLMTIFQDIEAKSEKISVILKMKTSSSLNGKFAAISQFLPKSVEKSLSLRCLGTKLENPWLLAPRKLQKSNDLQKHKKLSMIQRNISNCNTIDPPSSRWEPLYLSCHIQWGYQFSSRLPRIIVPKTDLLCECNSQGFWNN